MERSAEEEGGSVRWVESLEESVEGADVVYAAAWGSTVFHGRLDEERDLRRQHRDRRITRELMAQTHDGRFMHAMPVRRNVEADDGVIDARYSLVKPQAGNRLHIQRALFTEVLGG